LPPSFRTKVFLQSTHFTFQKTVISTHSNRVNFKPHPVFWSVIFSKTCFLTPAPKIRKKPLCNFCVVVESSIVSLHVARSSSTIQYSCVMVDDYLRVCVYVCVCVCLHCVHSSTVETRECSNMPAV